MRTVVFALSVLILSALSFYLFSLGPAYVVSYTDKIIADVGTNTSIECIANGIPDTIQYQWTKNGVAIPGSNGSMLNLHDVSVNDIGEYECVPSNSEGTHNTSQTELYARSMLKTIIRPRIIIE